MGPWCEAIAPSKAPGDHGHPRSLGRAPVERSKEAERRQNARDPGTCGVVAAEAGLLTS